MAWIKRNLFLVVGGLVALILLGVAGYFLFTKYGQDQTVTEQLTQNTEDLKKLVGRDPHPDANNIETAKAEHKKLLAFMGQVRRYFRPAITNHPSSREFRSMLDRTIAELQHGGERSGVQLPEDYWFTFSAQKAAMTFSTNLLGPLTAQLLDIRELCHILFDAKIISLERLRRVSVGQEDGGGALGTSFSQDYLEEKGTTNQWAIVTPYEITFQGFSSELAELLKGLIRSPNCFVVKNLAVERADATSTTDETTGVQQTSMPYSGEARGVNPYNRYGMNPMMNRYGAQGMPPSMMQRYGLMPGGAATLPPRPKGHNLLEERALRFTLTINSVKLKPSTGK